MLFHIKVSVFRKKFLIKDSMCRAENDIFLHIACKAIPIILISNEYYQFRMWYKLIGMKFTGEKHISSIAKDTEVQCFRFITQENLLRCFPFEMSNRYAIVYISCSCNSKLLPVDRHASSEYSSIVQHNFFVDILSNYQYITSSENGK